MPEMIEPNEADRRFMAAAIRLSSRHVGLTSTNPSVGTLIVQDDGNGPVIVGQGITALGGRPHAEPQALLEAGERARGATAYITLEPCAHHGRTPPCAEALVAAGVARVVGAAADPDSRVSGRGYAILRAAGIKVVEGVMAREAAERTAGYLMRSVRKRPEVTLKLAISRDGKIGRKGVGQVPITGEIARRQVHLMRARSDAILVGIGTVLADDPMLDCRLDGLENRSPVRIVLDAGVRLPVGSKLAATARKIPVFAATLTGVEAERRNALEHAGVRFFATERVEERVALPELLDDLGARGVASLMVEGGAETARHFLEEGLVDRIVLFTGSGEIGADGVASPIDADHMPRGFRQIRREIFGDDRCLEYIRKS
jgi:diaminohydroxyphosphoribosylaminopyrimidine deaminase/5-amino-6-(5-phosphoribosylamino)uracil reductase